MVYPSSPLYLYLQLDCRQPVGTFHSLQCFYLQFLLYICISQFQQNHYIPHFYLSGKLKHQRCDGIKLILIISAKSKTNITSGFPLQNCFKGGLAARQGSKRTLGPRVQLDFLVTQKPVQVTRDHWGLQDYILI